MKKQKGSVLLLIAFIFTFISCAISIVGFVFFTFNIAGISDFYGRILTETVSYNINVSEQITMVCIDFALSFLLDLYFAMFYLKGWRFRVNNPQYGRMITTQGLFQMILSSFIPGLLALIAGIVMRNRKVKIQEIPADNKPEFMSDYKLEAMSQAVARLKELKEKGAISEEEYYASLNKILEG